MSDPFTTAPTGEATHVTLYTDCRHPWYVRWWDRLRGRGHGEGHVIYHSALYSAAAKAILEGPTLDFDSDTVKMRLIDNDKDGE